jgi:ribosomal protein S19
MKKNKKLSSERNISVKVVNAGVNIKQSRNFFINQEHVGSRYAIYNGQKYISLLIRAGMVGHKFGEFVLTKRKIYSIHVSKVKTKVLTKAKAKAPVKKVLGKRK